MSSSSDPTDIIRDLSKLSAEGLQRDPNVRSKALRLSKQLASSLEDPIDVATQMAYTPLVATVVRIAVGLDVFAIINTHEGPVSTAQIATTCKGEELLISRFWHVGENLLLT